jgi:hypothetical protein
MRAPSQKTAQVIVIIIVVAVVVIILVVAIVVLVAVIVVVIIIGVPSSDPKLLGVNSMVHITTHGCSAQLHPQLLDVRQMDASQVLLPRNALRHMQATCVHTQACAHMQAHVLTCVNCKRTARR